MAGMRVATACLLLVGCGGRSGFGDEAPPEGLEGTSPLTALPDKGTVAITINPSQRLNQVNSGGGTVFTGFVNYVTQSNMAAPLLAAMPYRLNRVHFSGEVPDSQFKTQDRLASQFPQPSAPPAAWNLTWSDGPTNLAKRIRDLGGPDFIMSIHNAPTWMTASGKDGTKPANNAVYAQYCARLVSYYNKGSFVDDSGRTVTNPAGVIGIHYWEVWNEPEINDFGGGNTAVFTPTEYAQMFKTVSAAMRAADPTIKIGGPNSISDVDDTFQYFGALVSAGAQIDFVTYHQYQASSSQSDATAFTVASTLYSRPNTTLPIVISETNTDSEDNQSRTGSPFEWAAMPLEYKAHIEAGTWRVIRWETYEHNYNLIDATTGKPVTTYWAERTFWDSMREGTTRVGCTSSSADVPCIATIDGAGNVSAAFINRGVTSSTSNNGTGVRYQVNVSGVTGSFAKKVVDRNTDPAVGPAATIGAPTGIVIDGYGIATIRSALATDAGVQDTAPPDTGTPDTAVQDTGVQDTTVQDTAVQDTAVADTRVNDTAVADTSVTDTSVTDTAVTDTAVTDTASDATTTVNVYCSSLTLTAGSLGGNNSTACSGTSPSLANADSLSVDWLPATPKTSAYATYLLPTTKPASMRLVVRFHGDDKTEPLWYWWAQNNTGTWDLVGDNSWAGNWVTTAHTFTIVNPSNYVDPTGHVKIRFGTLTSTNDAELDQMILSVTY